jgi:hypothetical protein
MSTYNLSLASSGALTLRQQPEFDLEWALRLATIRLRLTEPLRKRRANNLEGFMNPDPHNYIASPAQGSTLNAGQFGSTFAQHPCQGCAPKQQAYDAETPARPQRTFKQHIIALFARAGR